MLYTKLLKFFAITTLTAVTVGSRHIPLHKLEGYDALLASMEQYTSNYPTLAPFPKPIKEQMKEQMVSLQYQVSDVLHELGFRMEKEPDSLCMDVFMLEDFGKDFSHVVAEMWDEEVKEARELIAAKIKGERKQKGWVLSCLHVRKNAKQ